MNSEALELSLKSEFENYLNDLFAELRQNAADFQKNFEAEFEKHKNQMDEAVRLMSERFQDQPQIDAAFQQAIVEHMRLAKDSGAELAAMAFSEAEKLAESSSATTGYDKIRDAINDVSSQTSQSTILNSLVEHAASFAPRGVFFIVKNDNFAPWKQFGNYGGGDDSMSSIKIPVDDASLLGRAVRQLETATGGYDENGPDRTFVEPLGLGRPDRMYAVPLVARGRGVAVLYVDYGIDGTSLNIEALETIVRVAGLSVELLAASQAVPAAVPQQSAAAAPEVEPVHAASDSYIDEYVNRSQTAGDDSYAFTPADEPQVAEMEAETEPHPEPAVYEDAYEVVAEDVGDVHVEDLEAEYRELENVETNASYNEDAVSVTEPSTTFDFEVSPEAVNENGHDVAVEAGHHRAEAATDFAFVEPDLHQPEQPAAFAGEPEKAEVDGAAGTDAFAAEHLVKPEQDNPPVDDAFAVAEPEPAPAAPEVAINGYNVGAPVSTPVVEVATAQPRSRFSDRNMELPIDVPEEERRLHNDARRFARLLVSEIKLYNEQKVTEGRSAGDLYDRLREAIDRSREMYDKRVQPAVASKFDYFHHELVNNLAEGDNDRMGASYKGATV